MKKESLEIKLEFINGLKPLVKEEVQQFCNLKIVKEGDDFIYLDFVDCLSDFLNLRSVLKVYLVSIDHKYNPLYISRHKSVLGNIISKVVEHNKNSFKSFKIIGAGVDSPEVRGIAQYIENTYKYTEEIDADMKIHIVKRGQFWEIGMQLTSMPLSVRQYKVRNMEGAMDPTIAYALNTLCVSDSTKRYLNIFSGSATLLIEAGLSNSNMQELVGFDNNKDHLSLAMKNIKEAGLIREIRLKEADIYNRPDFGKFDVVVSDLPFGMLLSKHDDLESLYKEFINYCEDFLEVGGVLGIYTSQTKLMEEFLKESKFKIVQKLDLKLLTSKNTYLYPKIYICKL